MDKIDIEKIGKSDADPKVIECYKSLKRFSEAPARKAWIERRNDCYKAAIENEMWDEKDKEDMATTGQVPLVINKLNKGIQGSAAIVTANKPKIRFTPAGSGDVYVAELLNRGHDYIWDKNEGSQVVYEAVEEKEIGGIGAIHAFHDESLGIHGCLINEAIDPTIVFFDADSTKRDLSDTHIIKAQLRSKKYIKKNYEDIKDEDLTFDAYVDIDDEKKTDTVTGEDNYAINPDKSDPAKTVDSEKKDIWEIEAWMLKIEYEDWVVFYLEGSDDPQAALIELKKGQTVDDFLKAFLNDGVGGQKVTDAAKWRRKMRNRYLRIIVGKKLIKQKSPVYGENIELDEIKNPYGTDADGNPVVHVILVKGQRMRSAYCTSPTFYAMPINKSKNKRRSQFIYAASKTLNSPVVRTDGTRWSDPSRPDAPGNELIMSKNESIAPFRLGSGEVDLSKLALLEDKDDRDIDDQYDLPEVMRGKLPPGDKTTSGRAVLALQDTSSVMKNPAIARLESSLVRLAKVNIAILLQTWPQYMWRRLLEDEEIETLRPDEKQQPQQMGMEQEQQPDEDMAIREETKAKWEEALEKIRPLDMDKPPGISLIDLDVKVVAGSSMPTNRMAKQQVALESFQAGLYDRKAALEYSDDPKAKEISERLDKQEQAALQAGLSKGK